MTVVRSLAAWIAFAIAGAFFGPSTAALVAVGVAAAVLMAMVRAGRRPAELVIEASAVVFFVAYAAVAVALPDAGHHVWVGPASQFWLAFTVGVTLAMGRPFTMAIAKQEAPQEIWDDPSFWRFNVRITRAWLVGFLAAGMLLSGLIVVGVHETWMSVLVIAAAIIGPILYTKRQIATLRKEQVA